MGGGLPRKRQRVVRQPTGSLRHPRRLRPWESRPRNQGTAPGPAPQPRDPHPQGTPAPGNQALPQAGLLRDRHPDPGHCPRPSCHNTPTTTRNSDNPPPRVRQPRDLPPTGNPRNPDAAVSPAATRPPPLGTMYPTPSPGHPLPPHPARPAPHPRPANAYSGEWARVLGDAQRSSDDLRDPKWWRRPPGAGSAS